MEITFFIWAGSNQGIVPMEVIEAYRAEHPEVTINILESNNAITYPQMVAAKRTTPDDPSGPLRLLQCRLHDEG